jgi:hypothetical protein
MAPATILVYILLGDWHDTGVFDSRFLNRLRLPSCMEITLEKPVIKVEVDLDKLVIAPPRSTWREWDNHNIHWEDYDVRAYYLGELASRLVISRAARRYRRLDPDSLTDRFFFDFGQAPPHPKPFVEWQGTEERFRGKGINGYLICYANEFYRRIFDSSLYSSCHFIINGGESARQVWRKLVKEGKAIYCPEEGKDRWRMI